MKVEWTRHAEIQMSQGVDYIRYQFGYKRKKQFIREVDQTVRILLRSPNAGFIDPLFDTRPITYRSVIINSLNKMVYYIDGETIYIAAFWDTRREPNAQAAQVK